MHINVSPKIRFTDNFFTDKKLIRKLVKTNGKIGLITCKNILNSYFPNVIELEKKISKKISIFSVSSNEKNKSFDMVKILCKQLNTEKFKKDSILIVMGGGIILDLGLLVAALYLRGLNTIAVPTTLLGMVDASIGGKTGVNFFGFKNILGTYFVPESIYYNFCFLKTLPKLELFNGFMEIIKIGVVANSKILKMLENYHINPSSKAFFQIIKIAIFQKKKIVASDFYDRGKRNLLNYGHTIGHGLEKTENFLISHGQAIAIGILTESYLLTLSQGLTSLQLARIYKLINLYATDLRLLRSTTFEKLLDALVYDKKNSEQNIYFTQVKNLGKGSLFRQKYLYTPSQLNLKKSLDWMLKNFKKCSFS